MTKFFLAILLATSAFAQDADLAKQKAALDRAERTLKDWANLGRYRDANASTPAPKSGEDRIVMMGDSITDGWGKKYGKFFTGKPYLNRGIGGQTTPQMLIRFRADVIAMKPKVVVILAGTNDIAGNTGPSTLEMIEDNLTSMAELAKANGIRVVFSAVMPVCDYIRPQTERRPLAKIQELNAWMKAYSAKNGLGYIDYYTPMLDDKGVFKQELTYDGLHPNDAGYEVMLPLVENAVAEALKK